MRDEHPLRLAFIGVVMSLLYLTILLPLGFLEGTRLRSYDSYCKWRNMLQPPPPETDQILLISIDEASQRHLEQKWPWDRSLLATLLAQVDKAQPKLVLLDLVLSGNSTPEHDLHMADTIRGLTAPILLASYIDRHGDPMPPLELFTQAGGIPGLINKPRDADQAVRRLLAAVRVPLQRQPLYAIEVKAAALAKGVPLEEIRLQGPLRIGQQEFPLNLPGFLDINYLARSDQIPTVSFWEVLEGRIPPEKIRGKVVFLGSTQEITHDVYPSSLGLMPGVVISANGLLTLTANRPVRHLPLAGTLVWGILFVTAIQLLVYRLSIPRATVAALALVGASVGLGFLAVFFWDAKVEWLSIVILGGTAWLSGFLYKSLLLATEALRLYNQAVTHPMTGLAAPRYFRLKIDQAWTQAQHKRLPLSLLAVWTGKLSELVQNQPWEEAEAQLHKTLIILKTHKPRRALLGHLGDDRFGVLLRRIPLSEAQAWARRLQQMLPSATNRFALGLIGSEQHSFTSAEDWIRALEATLERSRQLNRGELAIFDPQKDKVAAQLVESSQPTQATPLGYVASELEERNRAVEKALLELRKAHKEMEEHFLEVTKTLVKALETKDEYTAGHLERVCRYSTRLAQVLGLSKEDEEAIREASLLHDIGKIGLPDEVLHKIGVLTPEEHKIIRQHLEIGAKILEPMKFFKPITSLIYHHHERYDGKGYPHGLAGEFIPAGAQVIAIADAFDAMTTHRGYNKPKTLQEALAELKNGSGTQFNPEYVERFAKLVEQEGPQLAPHTLP